MLENYKCCAVIPCFNHAYLIEDTLKRVKNFLEDIIIVDDGSKNEDHLYLENLAKEYSAYLITNKENEGKGSATYQGCKKALELGFTHAFQIDADGQHEIEKINEFIRTSQKYPKAIISGYPIYDESIPKSRLYGRKITNFWVSIETLSLLYKESMCGFRIYPLKPCINLMKLLSHARMSYDIELLVRAFYQSIPTLYINIKVIYPKNGVSNFKAFQDNLKISWMHTKLTTYSLFHLHKILKIKRKLYSEYHNSKALQHWANIKEVKGLYGMILLVKLYNLLGRRVSDFILYFVVFFYWACSKRVRFVSNLYINNLKEYQKSKQLKISTLTSYRHVYSFASSILDKIASWQGNLKLNEDVFYFQKRDEVSLDAVKTTGHLILISHLGDIEVCRALVHKLNYAKINALVFQENAQKFKQVLDKFAPENNINLLSVSTISAETAILLQEKIKKGESVAIVLDRVPVNKGRDDKFRVSYAPFLGKEAAFSQGGIILGSILACPVITLFGLKKRGKIYIHCDPFADRIVLPRTDREKAIKLYIEKYAKTLEKYTLEYEDNWYNFFDFWQKL